MLLTGSQPCQNSACAVSLPGPWFLSIWQFPSSDCFRCVVFETQAAVDPPGRKHYHDRFFSPLYKDVWHGSFGNGLANRFRLWWWIVPHLCDCAAWSGPAHQNSFMSSGYYFQFGRFLPVRKQCNPSRTWCTTFFQSHCCVLERRDGLSTIFELGPSSKEAG